MRRTFRNALGTAGALALAALPLAGCGDDPTPPGGAGETRIKLTDAPFPYDSVERVELYVVRIAASTQADTADGAQWVTVATPRRRFDVLALQQGTTALVGSGELPAGSYRAVRMVIDTDSSGIVLRDGSDAQVQWPVAGELALHALVEAPMDVTEAGADIVIDVDLGHSFFHWGGNRFSFMPVIRAVNEAATGVITGLVTGDPQGDGSVEPIANANVSVFRDVGNSFELVAMSATGRTDAQGRYRIAFLMPDDYIVVVETPHIYALGPSESRGIVVTAGATTTHDISLPAADHSYLVIEGATQVAVNATTELRARVADARGQTLPAPVVTWEAAHPAVATLAANGDRATVTGVADGWAVIVARSGLLADSVRLRVGTGGGVDTVTAPPPPPVASLTVTPAALTLTVRDTLRTLTATARDAAGAEILNYPVAFATSDSSVALVYGSGRGTAWVQPRAPGTATITAFAGGKSAAATVTVVP